MQLSRRFIFAEKNYRIYTMIDFKKWLSRYDEGGFINTRYEKIERIIMWVALIAISFTLIFLIIWVIIESKTHTL